MFSLPCEEKREQPVVGNGVDFAENVLFVCLTRNRQLILLSHHLSVAMQLGHVVTSCDRSVSTTRRVPKHNRLWLWRVPLVGFSFPTS